MVRSFRGLMLMLGIFCSLSLALTAPVAAQSADWEDVDVEGIGDTVLDADPDTLLDLLEDPMRDKELPEGFADATFVDPNDEDAEAAGILGGDDLDGSLGSVAYTLAADPDVLGGQEAIASIQYVVLDDGVVDEDTLDKFIEGAEEGTDAAQDEGTEASVDTIDLNGVDAAIITFVQEDEASSVVVNYVAIPVGNTFVFAAVTLADEDAVDPNDVEAAVVDLTLSAISYLGTVAEDAAA